MDGLTFDAVATSVRKKRSNTSRRPRPDSLPITDSPPPLDTTFSNKDFNLNEESSSHKFHSADYDGNGTSSKSSSDRVHNGSDSKGSAQGVLATSNWKATQSKRLDSHLVSDGSGNENKLRKVKLKVGGVTRTIHAKSSSVAASSMKPSRSSDASRPRPKLILQDMSDDDESPPSKSSGLQGVAWKDFPAGGGSGKNDDFSRTNMQDESVLGKQSEATRKSKRVPKPRVLDGAFSDEDVEIRYLERFKTPKKDHGAEDEDEKYEGVKKERKVLSVSRSSRAGDGGYEEDFGYGSSSRSGKDRDREGKKKSGGSSRSEKITRGDTDYVGEDEEEEGVGEEDMESDMKRKKQRKESIDMLMDGKKEMSLTTRQRAMQKDRDSPSGGSLIEYPNGLPPAAPRKQKEKLSEVEQQLKKAEAAQRRRMQVEKAARESEAEAIRKILGQDSSRKKREDKLKKRRDEIAQEKAASAMTIPPNTIRWVLGPTGTVVTFPEETGLPSIFTSNPPAYPPPREKCAASSCTNAYKYRDSKSKLPLCSLECYKAVNHPLLYHPSSC
ncbi:hypothetical protein ACHQM5_025735 [Ranunculus cassubicifolius]